MRDTDLTETTTGEKLLDSFGQALASSLGPCERLLPSSHPRSHKALFIAAGGRERQPWKKAKSSHARTRSSSQMTVCIQAAAVELH